MRGHRYAGARFDRDWSRHFGGSPKSPPPTTAAPRKTDAEIEEEARQARLASQRRRGRGRTVLTSGDEPKGPVTAGSIGTPGARVTLG
jgi:hypothetical protein